MPERLLPCVESPHDKVVLFNERLEPGFVRKQQVDILISYNYRHIIEMDVLKLLNGRAYNLHASLLPLNRGAHPVLWSILHRTPLGVSVHQLDEGLDTGPILFQKTLSFTDELLSLRSVYEMVNQELVALFCQNWSNIRNKGYQLKKQLGLATVHRSSEADGFLVHLNQSWETTIQEARISYEKYLEEIRNQ